MKNDILCGFRKGNFRLKKVTFQISYILNNSVEDFCTYCELQQQQRQQHLEFAEITAATAISR